MMHACCKIQQYVQRIIQYQYTELECVILTNLCLPIEFQGIDFGTKCIPYHLYSLSLKSVSIACMRQQRAEKDCSQETLPTGVVKELQNLVQCEKLDSCTQKMMKQHSYTSLVMTFLIIFLPLCQLGRKIFLFFINYWEGRFSYSS